MVITSPQYYPFSLFVVVSAFTAFLSGCLAQQADTARMSRAFDSKISDLDQRERQLNQKIEEAQNLILQQRKEAEQLVSEARARLRQDIRDIQGGELPKIHGKLEETDHHLKRNREQMDNVQHRVESLTQLLLKQQAENEKRLGSLENSVNEQLTIMRVAQDELRRHFEAQGDVLTPEQSDFLEKLVALDDLRPRIESLSEKVDLRLQQQEKSISDLVTRVDRISEGMSALEASTSTPTASSEAREVDASSPQGKGEVQADNTGPRHSGPEVASVRPELPVRKPDLPVPEPLSAREIAERYGPSVVTIVAMDSNDQPRGIGSGFVINDEGHVATNYHVLAGSAKAIVKTMSQQLGEIQGVIGYDQELDLLVVDTDLRDMKILQLADSDTVTVGEDIIVIGNPRGLEGTVSKGILSGVRDEGDIKFLQITAPVSPGSSGGPVFNVMGHVIGIASFQFVQGQNLNFAMPINYLSSLKPVSIALTDLPEYAPKLGKERYYAEAVKAHDIHLNYMHDDQTATSLDFVIRNGASYAIKNIRVFFIYRNAKGDIVSYSHGSYDETILPKLALQFHHGHTVKHFNAGKVEIRVLDYDIDQKISTPFPGFVFK